MILWFRSSTCLPVPSFVHLLSQGSRAVKRRQEEGTTKDDEAISRDTKLKTALYPVGDSVLPVTLVPGGRPRLPTGWRSSLRTRTTPENTDSRLSQGCQIDESQTSHSEPNSKSRVRRPSYFSANELLNG